MTTNIRRGAGKQRIDYKEAEQMLRSGATQAQVADRFGVTQGAVHLAIQRGNIKHAGYSRVYRDEAIMPWHPIMPEHRGRHLARMLRAAARQEKGLPNVPAVQGQLDRFLEAAAEGGWVVHYDPDTAEGFFRVPRRDGIDTGLVRDPELDDNGRRVRRKRAS